MKNMPPEIMYITSIGHSGSTILDMILETIPHTFSVGEVMDLEKFCRQEDRFDESGTLLEDSKMWSPFCEDIEGYKTGPAREHISLLQKMRQILLSPNSVGPQYDDKKFFSDIAQVASKNRGEEIKRIIDSSKSPRRLVSLTQNDHMNTKIIHLVRSPWGVVYSNVKNDKSAFLACLKWLRTNISIWFYLFWNVESNHRVRVIYSRLCTAPRKELDRISNALDVPKVPSDYITRANQIQSYKFTGNSVMQREFAGVKLDTRWRKNLSWPKKILSFLLCGWLYFFLKLKTSDRANA